MLNALVQDLIRAVAFLHSKHVMHCDIKPGNLLVSFNRSGKRKECKPRNFHLAQLVVAGACCKLPILTAIALAGAM